MTDGTHLSRFDPDVFPGEAAGEREDGGTRRARPAGCVDERGDADGDRGGGDGADPEQPRERSAADGVGGERVVPGRGSF